MPGGESPITEETMIRWGEFAQVSPELAGFGASRFDGTPPYLATVTKSGGPRVHPVTPIFTTDGLYVFMEPNSPKAADLRYRSSYAMHNGVPDNAGTGGEFFISGQGVFVTDPSVRAVVTAASSYKPADRYVLFELLVVSARCNGYGDVTLPAVTRWSAV